MRPKAGQHAYCASKAATIALSRSLALELAAAQIRVNVINPGAAETPMLAGFVDPALPLDQAKERFAQNIPMGALIHHATALFLASSAARHVTGAVLNVDGGRSI